MIINTGQRTDIPAFYAKWFANRLTEGFVCVRNPYNLNQVNRYQLTPKIVDVIGFCTKNPMPMFEYMDLLKEYGQYWHVSITPYGKDVEPNVPNKHYLLEAFKKLSDIVGTKAICWRYDPIFLSDKYTIEYHIKAFSQMASILEGATKTCVISFIDLYPKVIRNFSTIEEVAQEQRIELGKKIIEIADFHKMKVKVCAEGDELSFYGADCSGCMTIEDYQNAIGKILKAPKVKGARKECACYLSCDIGAYNSCKHLCRYCYANASSAIVFAQSKLHDPSSPFLIGNYQDTDRIHDICGNSWIDKQFLL